MQAALEFFSGAATAIPPDTEHVSQVGFGYGTWAFPGLATLVKGEPLDRLQYQMPVGFLLVPSSREYRPMAQHKFIDYDVELYLEGQVAGVGSAGDMGAAAINEFYGLLDAIADRIRTNKILLTPSYPGGAAIRFGEDFTVEEAHRRDENTILLAGRFRIKSTEQVNA